MTNSQATPENLAINSPDERRLYHRYTIGLDAKMIMDERRVSCRITDLSLGGARVVCESCENAGEIVYLVIPTMGQGTPIRSRVVASELDQASLRFELDEHSEAALIMHLMADPATHDML